MRGRELTYAPGLPVIGDHLPQSKSRVPWLLALLIAASLWPYYGLLAQWPMTMDAVVWIERGCRGARGSGGGARWTGGGLHVGTVRSDTPAAYRGAVISGREHQVIRRRVAMLRASARIRARPASSLLWARRPPHDGSPPTGPSDEPSRAAALLESPNPVPAGRPTRRFRRLGQARRFRRTCGLQRRHGSGLVHGRSRGVRSRRPRGSGREFGLLHAGEHRCGLRSVRLRPGR